MTDKEFIYKIDSGEANVLTVEAAKNLKGKKYFGCTSDIQEMKMKCIK